MTKHRGIASIVFYIILLILFVGATWLTLTYGASLSPSQATSTAPSTLPEAFTVFSESVQHHMSSTIGLLLMQILVILIAARGMGWLFRKIHQPAVIGEIVAGILLGPSLLGKVSPELFNYIFPSSSISNIQLLSNFGLILFMFAVGMELRLSDIKERLRSSLIISHAGIFLPFALSFPLSLYIYPKYAAEYTSFLPFALFVGIAMSITAFPVLARIIQENNLLRKPLGKLSLSTAAASDITAWLMLAAIIAISQSGSMLSTVYNLAFLILYVLIMFGVIRPLFRIAGKVYDNTEVIGHTLVGVIFILLLLSSYVTELLSMHALFGAFILGLVMPEDLSFRKIITDKVEDVSLLLFLPLFFVSSGLQTELGLIDSPEMWVMLAVFTAIAVVGKVLGTYVSARACGEKTKESLYLGAFMNTRGLMELVVLAIGYEMGILPPSIYVVLVLMTVITTVMTMPMVHLINKVYEWRKHRGKKPHVKHPDQYSALLSFGRPQSGATLLRLTDQLLRRGDKHPHVTALHITTNKSINTIDADKYFHDNFLPLSQEAEKLNQMVALDYQVADSVEEAIIDKLKQERFNLLIVGAGIRLSDDANDRAAISMRDKLSHRIGSLSVATTERLLSIRNLVRDKMQYFIDHAPCSVAILLGRDYSMPKRILLCVESEADMRLLAYARTLAENNQAYLDLHSSNKQTSWGNLHQSERIVSSDLCVTDALMEGYDLLVVSHEEWMRSYDNAPETLACLPSTLIMSLKNGYSLDK